MARAGISLKYFTPAIKPRILPTFKPHISATGISGVHIAPRILPTPLSGLTSSLSGGVRIPKVSGLSGLSSQAPKVKTLLTQTHTGRPPSSNPQSGVKPTTSAGFPSGRASMRLQTSAKAQQPGIHSIQGIKVKARQSNPLKIHTPSPFKFHAPKVL